MTSNVNVYHHGRAWRHVWEAWKIHKKGDTFPCKGGRIMCMQEEYKVKIQDVFIWKNSKD